ncbi:MAG: AGE family epimerase/isomerase [Candidatus Heimdallarchaeota archaeon]
MLITLSFRNGKTKWLNYALVIILANFLVFQSFAGFLNPSFICSNHDTRGGQIIRDSDEDPQNNFGARSKLTSETADDPEAYFPNFLYYSVEIANALIDYLYDNTSGGFYVSTGVNWDPSSVNRLKRTYDNAQAILALLKLSDAVINEAERNFAIEIAIKTGNCLIRDLYDNNVGGFYIASNNQYKKPGVNAKAIQALLALYETTGNQSYHEIALSAQEFLDSHAWKSSNGYYVYLLAHYGATASENPNPSDPFDPGSIRVDHNALMGDVLLNLYKVENDEKYLNKAIQIFDFLNETCRDPKTGLFYDGLDSENNVVSPSSADIFTNTLVLGFLANLYNSTDDIRYYYDFMYLINIVMLDFWDSRYGGFYATYSSDESVKRDEKKYTERLFYGISALDKAYKLTDKDIFYNIILDVVEFLNNKLYDQNHLGYYQITNADGSIGSDYWNNKFSVTQALSIYELSNLWMYSKPGVLNAIWSPSNPRPQESVTVTVAASDSDGIADVLFNYTVDEAPYELISMDPSAKVGDLYNVELPPHTEGTKIRFFIIVNDTFGNQVVRGFYEILWRHDVWAPHIAQVGFDPSVDIIPDTEFSIVVTAIDVPVQGEVRSVRMYYHLSGEPEESVSLNKIGPHLWKVSFPTGLHLAGTYAYYFEAIDDRGNYGYGQSGAFQVLAPLQPVSISFIVLLLTVVLVGVPGGLYGYVELKKKSARKTLKSMRAERYHQRRGSRARRGVKSTK